MWFLSLFVYTIVSNSYFFMQMLKVAEDLLWMQLQSVQDGILILIQIVYQI